MTQFIIYFLLVYFILFFGVAVIWRNYSVSKSSGVNALKLNQKNGPEAITGIYFKFLPLLSIFVFIVFAVLPEIYLMLGPVDLFINDTVQYIGIGLMIIALSWLVVAQSQMGPSWRIGIDHEQRTEFVEKGLFKYSRNPIFVGIILISLGFFLLLPNSITLTILVLDIALIQIQVAMEEEHLTKHHGSQYKDYCERVRRWV